MKLACVSVFVYEFVRALLLTPVCLTLTDYIVALLSAAIAFHQSTGELSFLDDEWSSLKDERACGEEAIAISGFIQ